MSNGQNSFVSEALADGLLQQLVCLLIHTGCGLIDAQHLPGTESEGSSQAPQQRPHSLPGDSLRSQHRTSVPITLLILQRSPLLSPDSHGQLPLPLAPMEAVHSPWPVSGGLWPDTPAASVPQTDSFPSLPARCSVHLQGSRSAVVCIICTGPQTAPPVQGFPSSTQNPNSAQAQALGTGAFTLRYKQHLAQFP